MTPPMPPQIREQQGPQMQPSVAAGMADAQGGGGEQGGVTPQGAAQQGMQQLAQQVAALEKAIGETFQSVQATAPQLKPLFAPMVSAGAQLKEAIGKMVQSEGRAVSQPEPQGMPAAA